MAAMENEATNDLPEHVVANRARWDDDAPNWVASGERSWAAEEPTWGEWGIPESIVECCRPI